MDRAKCRGCGADIWWTITAAGRKVPLDAVPEKRYVIDSDIWPPPRAHLVDAYMPHFATCPKRDEFRKKSNA